MSMSRRSLRRRERIAPARVDLTPMIDVVFLLLIFFVATIAPQDVFGSLRMTAVGRKGAETNIVVLRMNVMADGYKLNGRRVTLREMGDLLDHMGAYSTETGVVVVCDVESMHSGLVKVLDLCARAGFRNVSMSAR